MSYTYIVPLQLNPTKSELHAAWWFTVISRAEGRCQHCNAEVRLHACHLKSRRQHPKLAYDPENGIALCSSCHKKYDHANGHIPNGRPTGYQHSEETRHKIGEKKKRWIEENLEEHREQCRRSWDGRRKPDRDCEHCGEPIPRFLVTRNARFCSKDCRYSFQRGKPRSGW